MLADIIHVSLLADGRILEDIVLNSLMRMNRLFGAYAHQMAQFDGLIRRAVELAAADVPDTEAIAVAVFCALRYQDDMAGCLCAAVTHSGDSDSAGAIAGNILGAWLGEKAILADWLEVLELRTVVEAMADKLYEASLI